MIGGGKWLVLVVVVVIRKWLSVMVMVGNGYSVNHSWLIVMAIHGSWQLTLIVVGNSGN